MCVCVCVCVCMCVFTVSNVHLHLGKLDDEVAESVYESRGDMTDMDSITQLTSDNFHAAVAQSSLTVALFYLRCKTHSPNCP